MDITFRHLNTLSVQNLAEGLQATGMKLAIVLDEQPDSATIQSFSSYEDIEKALKALVEKYPEISFYGSESYSVREDDRSAEWWGTTSFESKVSDRKTIVVRREQTMWA